MARDRGFDAATQGMVLSAFFWGYLVSQLLGGWMADRFGGKRILAFGVVTWSLATILTPPASTSFPMLLLARVMLGLGEGVTSRRYTAWPRVGLAPANGRERSRST